MTPANIIQRAFEIAPECSCIEEVKKRLIGEGFTRVNAHLSGWQIRREVVSRLNAKLSASRKR